MKVYVKGREITVIPRRMRHLFGRTWQGRDKILIESTLIPGSIPYLSTLIHEMIHNMHWGLSEERVQHLELALVSMILSNPTVFADVAAKAPSPPRRSRQARRPRRHA